jgi:N-terminal acetyltransferase B complex non-catalytic subunit
VWLTLGPKHLHASRDITQSLTSLVEFLKTATLAIQAQEMDIGQDDRLEFTHFSEMESWYLHLEFAKTCVHFVTTATALLKQKNHHASGAIPTDALGKIKNEAKALGGAVQKQAKGLQTSLKKDGRQKVLQVIKAGGLGELIDQLTGGEQLRRYVDEMVDSAIEALEGVLKVKVG